jgi:AraC-like DNA-binding protein
VRLFNAPPLSQFAQAKSGATKTDIAAPAPVAGTIIPETPSSVRVLQLQRLAQAGRWRAEAMRALSEPCLIWFTRGQGRITLGGVTRGYGPHNAVFIPPGVMHGFEVGPQTHGLIVHFGRGTDVTLPHAAQHLRIRDTLAQSELSSIIDAVQRELASARPGAERAARHHLGLLGVWLERQIEMTPADLPRPNASKRLVARYTALLERDFRSGLGVADFAAELGVTPTHLTRVCRQNCGRGASELLQERRLYEARRLLAETRAPIKDIAATLGFTTAAYFARAFQAKTGKTPSAFRRGK